jgi:hypothetical protein
VVFRGGDQIEQEQEQENDGRETGRKITRGYLFLLSRARALRAHPHLADGPSFPAHVGRAFWTLRAGRQAGRPQDVRHGRDAHATDVASASCRWLGFRGASCAWRAPSPLGECPRSGRPPRLPPTVIGNEVKGSLSNASSCSRDLPALDSHFVGMTERYF